jgi:hypothetical protein
MSSILVGRAHCPKVTGSNPVPATILNAHFRLFEGGHFWFLQAVCEHLVLLFDLHLEANV